MNPQSLESKTQRIRQLNDELRMNFVGGTIVMTSGVAALDLMLRSELRAAIRDFDAFSPENDPHGEHDFGAIEIRALSFFFKIDYYDRSLTLHSPDAANPAVTTRVLTVMLTDEY
jgi:hypothetical protein